MAKGHKIIIVLGIIAALVLPIGLIFVPSFGTINGLLNTLSLLEDPSGIGLGTMAFINRTDDTVDLVLGLNIDNSDSADDIVFPAMNITLTYGADKLGDGWVSEMITIPEPGELEVLERQKPDVPHEWYHHFEITPTLVSPMAAMGEGYRYHTTGLTHDQEGFPTARPEEIKSKLDKLKNKIMRFTDELLQLESEMVEDASICVFAYGTAARAARQAVHMAREKRIRTGMIRPITIWPFPDEQISEMLTHVRRILVVELNQGQLIHEIERVAPKTCKVAGLTRYDGEVLNPVEIYKRILEVK